MKKFLTLVCAMLGISATMMAEGPEPQTEDAPESIADFTSLTLAVSNGIAITDAYLTYPTEVEDYEFELSADANTGYAGTGSTATAASYNTSTHTFDFGGCVAWSGCGWGWWSGNGFDASAYSAIEVVCSSTADVQFIVEGTAEESKFTNSAYEAYSSTEGSAQTFTLTISLADCNENLSQMYFQNSAANQTITVESITFVGKDDYYVATESLLDAEGKLVTDIVTVLEGLTDVDPETIAIVVEIDATAKVAEEGVDDVVLTGEYGTNPSTMSASADVATYETAIVTFTYDADEGILVATIDGQGDTTPAGPTEIAGYLTVTYEDDEVVQSLETSITVTTDADGKTTITMPDFNLTDEIAVADFTMTFELDIDGAFSTCEGSVNALNQTLSITDGEGTYVVDENGNVEFKAVVTAALGQLTLELEVSFTTIEPVSEETTWNLITDKFDDVVPGDIGSTNYTVTLTWAELANCLTLKVEAVTKATNSSYGCVLATADWTNSAIYSFESNGTTDKQETVYFDVEELKASCQAIDANSTEVYFVFWTSDIESVAFYGDGEIVAGTEEETTEDFILPIVDLFNAGSVSDWDSNTTAEVDETGTAIVATFVQDWGSYVFNNWSGWDLSAYDTAILTYSFDDEYLSSGNYAQLMIEDNVTYAIAQNSDNNIDRGVVTVDLNSNANLDLTNIGQIAVQTLAATTITIEEIRFTYTGTSTAIASVSSDTEVTEVARYNLMGQKISGAEKGINIIVYSDGSAKKVLVK